MTDKPAQPPAEIAAALRGHTLVRGDGTTQSWNPQWRCKTGRLMAAAADALDPPKEPKE